MARGVARLGSKTEVLKNLRQLLRLTRQRSSKDEISNCNWSQHVLAMYRTRQMETNRDKMRAFRAEANDFLMLLQGIEEQKYLWDLDAGAETKLSGQEIVNRSAKRVGLFVPNTYTEEDQETTQTQAIVNEEERKRQAATAYLAAKTKNKQ